MLNIRAAAVLATAALLAACSGGGNGLTTASVLDNDRSASAATEVGKFKNDDPNARPVFIGWTAARAQRCGFFFDETKLRASYLAFEQSQGASGPALGGIEKSYDTTKKTIGAKIAADADYCSERKAAEIKTELNRIIGGDYRSNFPQPKVATGDAGSVLWSDPSRDKFNGEKFWKDGTENRNAGRR